MAIFALKFQTKIHSRYLVKNLRFGFNSELDASGKLSEVLFPQYSLIHSAAGYYVLREKAALRDERNLSVIVVLEVLDFQNYESSEYCN